MAQPTVSLSSLLARCAGAAALVCLAAAPAQATTLAYQNYVYGAQTATITNLSPAVSATVGAGALLFSKVDNGVTSTLAAYCVDIFQSVSSSAQQYTLVNGVTHFGTAKADALGRLFTAFEVWNGNTSTTAQESSALQLAVWEIVNETATTAGKLNFNLSSGNFKATSTGSGTIALAQGWLDGLASANNWYQVGAYENGSYQDYLALNKVPEPGSMALVLGALGALGVASRRKKAKV
jgi:hypothetical protein